MAPKSGGGEVTVTNGSISVPWQYVLAAFVGMMGGGTASGLIGPGSQLGKDVAALESRVSENEDRHDGLSKKLDRLETSVDAIYTVVVEDRERRLRPP